MYNHAHATRLKIHPTPAQPPAEIGASCACFIPGEVRIFPGNRRHRPDDVLIGHLPCQGGRVLEAVPACVSKALLGGDGPKPPRKDSNLPSSGGRKKEGLGLLNQRPKSPMRGVGLTELLAAQWLSNSQPTLSEFQRLTHQKGIPPNCPLKLLTRSPLLPTRHWRLVRVLLHRACSNRPFGNKMSIGVDKKAVLTKVCVILGTSVVLTFVRPPRERFLRFLLGELGRACCKAIFSMFGKDHANQVQETPETNKRHEDMNQASIHRHEVSSSICLGGTSWSQLVSVPRLLQGSSCSCWALFTSTCHAARCQNESGRTRKRGPAGHRLSSAERCLACPESCEPHVLGL